MIPERSSETMVSFCRAMEKRRFDFTSVHMAETGQNGVKTPSFSFCRNISIYRLIDKN